MARAGAGRGQRLERRAPEAASAGPGPQPGDGAAPLSGQGGAQPVAGQDGAQALTGQAGPPAGYYPPTQGRLPPGVPAPARGAPGRVPYPSGAPGRLLPGEPPGVPGALPPRPPADGLVPTGAPPGSARRGAALQGPYAPGPRPPGPYPGLAPVRQGPGRAPRPAPSRARAEGGRPRLALGPRNRRVVRHLDIWSVAKVSFIFYFCVLIVLLVAGAVLWNVAAAFGVITTLEKLVRSLFALSSFKVHPLAALAWGAAIGGALCFIGIVVNVLAAVLYNLISDIVGGLQVVVLSDEDT
jgi:hypothetical protein